MKERRILLYLILPALLLLIAVFIVTQDFFGDQGVNLGRPAPESGTAPGAERRVYIEAEIFSDLSNPDTLYLALTQATVPAPLEQDPDTLLCLHGVYITPALETSGGDKYPDAPYDGPDGRDDEPPTFHLDPPLCNFQTTGDGRIQVQDNPNTDLILAPDEPFELFLDEGAGAIRFYPFDTLSGSWDIYPLVLAPDGALRPDVDLALHLTARLADWKENITLRPEELRFELTPNLTSDWPAQELQVQLSRTRTQRLLTVVLLGFLTILILGLIFVRDNSSLLEIVIGVLLGLWGIQSVVIPSYIQSRTLVHYWIIILYILLGLVAYVRLVGIPLVQGVDVDDAIASLDDEFEPQDEEESDQQTPA